MFLQKLVFHETSHFFVAVLNLIPFAFALESDNNISEGQDDAE